MVRSRVHFPWSTHQSHERDRIWVSHYPHDILIEIPKISRIISPVNFPLKCARINSEMRHFRTDPSRSLGCQNPLEPSSCLLSPPGDFETEMFGDGGWWAYIPFMLVCNYNFTGVYGSDGMGVQRVSALHRSTCPSAFLFFFSLSKC